MLNKTKTPEEIPYLWNERLLLVHPQIFIEEVAAEIAIVDGGLAEGVVLELSCEDFKICVKINKELCYSTPRALLDVTVDIYEQNKI